MNFAANLKPELMKSLYKKIILLTVFSALFITSAISSFGQENQAASISQSADTLNAKIENLKSDLDILKKLKITGYIQAQWQLADTAGQLSPFSGGNFPKYSDNRFQLRRGRVKFTYDGKLTQYVLQIDATQSGVTLKDAYVNFKDPWLQMFMVQGGVFNRPFGFEIAYSSSSRETPERARVTQTLFPGERDLGAMLTIQPRKDSRFNFIRLNAALICGNGIALDIDSHKDFVGQLGINKTTKNEKLRYAAGVSYYNGGYYQETKNVYSMATLSGSEIKGFMVDSTATNQGEYAKRVYYGADAQLTYDWLIGTTSLRGEYIFGDQPGTSKSNVSPNGRAFSVTEPTDTYNRPFNGGYVYFIQNILHSRHEIVVKYDWLDPNTDVAGEDIASTVSINESSVKTNLSAADIKYTTWGIGYNVRIAANVKLMAYYEFVKNEITKVSGYTRDLPDNVFTLRAQFKF